jgi:subtilisin family serine protease
VKRFALVVVAAALQAPAADAARYAVGARTIADLPRLSAILPNAESLAPIPALVVEQPTAPRLADLPGATYVERLGYRKLAFVPNDPIAAKQWHLGGTRAFDFWESSALALALPPVRVAIIDSGIDATHPELVDKIVKGGMKSFVGGSASVDVEGHGTFVAGLIAASVDNAAGIAGMAPTAELLVAKVVVGGDVIDVEAEAKAIEWAVRNGAKVINLSLGGLRDPRDPDRDTFSQLEADAVGYAHGKGVVVVAAVGNAERGATKPWLFASYPAALPHVLGVSALARDGSVPLFSNRDKLYNDIAAPGAGVISTMPLEMTAPYKECLEQGFSICGPEEWRKGEGTSFAAPQVSAAAAVILAMRRNLRPEQVTALLTETARDVNAATGCQACPPRRDAFTGWGRLDVTAALRQLSGVIPPPDKYEPNDDGGEDATRLWGLTRRIEATLDFWDDQSDVYAIRLRRGQPVYASVRGPAGTDTNLILWQPSTRHVYDLASLALVARQSARPGAREYLQYRAPATGTYYVQVKLGSRGAGKYKLTIVKA